MPIPEVGGGVVWSVLVICVCRRGDFPSAKRIASYRIWQGVVGLKKGEGYFFRKCHMEISIAGMDESTKVIVIVFPTPMLSIMFMLSK